jgi:hypothetical protein
MPQSRKPGGFSWPQLGHLAMVEAYDANAGEQRALSLEAIWGGIFESS